MATNTVAYLDNNATTLMPETIVQEMAKWANQGNPSASYTSAKRSQEMMSEFREFIGRSVGCPVSKYMIIFTSGATEANCMIVRGVIERARRTKKFARATNEFHVVVSAMEHKSILLLLDDLVHSIPEMSLTIVDPDSSGHIQPEDFVRALRPSTCLAICMHGNNETGAINDIAAIGREIKAHESIGNPIFFHSDIVQTFGKIPVDLTRANVDGASASFHKLHGPPGVGVAIMRRSMMKDISPIIYGTQSFGMRGGTENVIGIGTAFAAVRLTMSLQSQTIIHELELKSRIISRLAARSPVTTFDKYMQPNTKMELQIVIVSDGTFLDPNRYLPGTIMLSVAKHIGPPACNTLIKEKLENDRVIVSVGSACNTSAKEHSHVLRSMKIPSVMMDGAIRVSMCGYTTSDEVDKFVDGFLKEADRQYRSKIPSALNAMRDRGRDPDSRSK